MGKSKKCRKQLDIIQKPLEASFLTADTLFEETKAIDTVITWVVRNYSKLETNVYYIGDTMKYNRYWSLRLLRLSCSLCVFLCTNVLVSNIVIFFLQNDGQVMDSTISVGMFNVYEAKLDEKLFPSPSEQLKDDILIIQCIYTARPYESAIFLMPGLQECNELKSTSDVDILFNDLKDLYLTGRLSDFVLTVGKATFKVHKLILCRHSKYLARMLAEDPDCTGEEFTIDGVPAMMNEVLLYIYSGEMRNMHLDCMTELYHLACILEIASLQTICVHYFKSMFSIHNVKDLLEIALHEKQEDFQKEIINFLNKQPQSVLQTKVWADVIRNVSDLVEDDLSRMSHN